MAAMRGMCVFAVALSALLAHAGPAPGADVQGVLRAFGLIGAWAHDCSKQSTERGSGRVVFAAPTDGAATATAQDARDDGLTTTVYEITDSTKLGDDRIDVALHPVKVAKPDGKPPSPHDYDNLRLVFRKVGERVELVRIQFEGLPEIERAIFFDRCAN